LPRAAVALELVGSHAPAGEAQAVDLSRFDPGVEQIGELASGDIERIRLDVVVSFECFLHVSVLFDSLCRRRRPKPPDRYHAIVLS